MSERNRELVRRSFEALVGGDFETAFAAYDAHAEWKTAEDEPDSRTHRGIDEVERLVRSFAEPWTDRFERAVLPEDYIDLGDWIVVPTRGRLHGKGSGVEVEVVETYAVRVRDDRIIRVEEYRTKNQALDAIRQSRR
jgi:ketosteroid isomerase-like protein